MNADRAWRVLSSEIRIDTPFLRLRADRIALPNGDVIDDYWVRESHGFCVILAVTPDERAVIVRQYKHGVGEVVTEIPAGAIEPDETPAACAARELREETGYVGRLTHVRTFLTDPTSSNSRFHLFLARDARPTAATQFDPTEEIETRTVALDELRAMALDGRIAAGSQVAAVLVGLDAYARRT